MNIKIDTIKKEIVVEPFDNSTYQDTHSYDTVDDLIKIIRGIVPDETLRGLFG